MDGLADREGSAPRAVPVSPMPNSPLWPASPLTGEGSQRSKGGQRAVRCEPTCMLLTQLGQRTLMLGRCCQSHH